MTMPNHNSSTNVLSFPLREIEEDKHNYQSAEAPAAAAVSSSTTTVRKVPVIDKFARQSLAMEQLKTEFYDSFGREMPRAICEQVLRDIRTGTPSYYYSYAIEQTLYAPRPSWRYTLAIVARLKRTMASEDDMDYREGR